jgi:hypothetical protein
MKLPPRNSKRIPISCPVQVVRFPSEHMTPRPLSGEPTTQLHQPGVFDRACSRLSTAIAEPEKRRPFRRAAPPPAPPHQDRFVAQPALQFLCQRLHRRRPSARLPFQTPEGDGPPAPSTSRGLGLSAPDSANTLGSCPPARPAATAGRTADISLFPALASFKLAVNSYRPRTT